MKDLINQSDGDEVRDFVSLLVHLHRGLPHFRNQTVLCLQFQDAAAWVLSLVMLPRAIVFSGVVSTYHIKPVKL